VLPVALGVSLGPVRDEQPGVQQLRVPELCAQQHAGRVDAHRGLPHEPHRQIHERVRLRESRARRVGPLAGPLLEDLQPVGVRHQGPRPEDLVSHERRPIRADRSARRPCRQHDGRGAHRGQAVLHGADPDGPAQGTGHPVRCRRAPRTTRRT
jgi:hypothetical protein